MNKLVVVSVLLAATLFVAGTSLASKAPARSLPCKTVKFKVTRQVWNAKHTKKITVDVYKLVKETVEVRGKKKVELVKEQVYKTEKICTAGLTVTSTTVTPVPVPTTTVPGQVTPAPTTQPTTTTTAAPSPVTTTTTTTVPATTTTTVPGSSSIVTGTTQAPVNTGYPTTCGPTPAYCDSETVFSVVIKAPGVDVSPGAGQLQFVFDAPETDTDGGDAPYEFNQFTLVTTQDGQTACPLQWQSGAPLSPGWWQADPESVATGGIPACTMTNVSLYDGASNISYPCTYLQPFTGPLTVENPTPTDLVMPCGIAPGLEDGDVVGAALTWEVTADFIGEGAYAPSDSADQNFTVVPSAT